YANPSAPVTNTRAATGFPMPSTTRNEIRPIGFRYFRSRVTTSVCSPPGIVCTHNEVFPLRLEMNAIFDPSGDHRGFTLSKAPYEMGNASPPTAGINHS